ncbi:MAG TPA: BON domain-containing protein [Vicinamibacteria bacterium]|jgi:osmotically-inducible protein OsmY
MRLRNLSILAALALSATAASAALAFDEKSPAAKNRPDAWVAAKAKIVLLTDDDVDGTDIHVAVKDGVVTLSGRADSEMEKAEAERRVKKLDGVKGVHNLVQIVPPGAKKAVKAEDKTVQAAVEARLKTETGLKDIGVESVTAGVVILKGKGSLDQTVRAVEIARSVPGVTRVVNHIESPQA